MTTRDGASHRPSRIILDVDTTSLLRLNPHTTAIVEYLQEFVRLACLIVQKEGTLPEQYSHALATMFEHGDLEIYKRNPKRPSRLIHAERVRKFVGLMVYAIIASMYSPFRIYT